MRRIPQRELRNQSSAILRAAEAGEEFVITVDGRPVATLGPYARGRWVVADKVRAILRTPTDPELLKDLRKHADDRPSDPWARA